MRRAIALFAFLLLTSVPSAATVIRVPDDVTAVDAALLAAAPFDTILVAPGTYFVSLEWPATSGIKLLSQSGALTTILDGRDNATVIALYTGVDTTTVVRGFTIQRGNAQVEQ